MGAENGVRWLTLLSGSVLFYSTLLQLWWQRIQAKRDEKPPANGQAGAGDPPPPAATISNVPAAVAAEEAANIPKYREVQRQNAIRPFFDPKAFRLFLMGFAVSVLSSALDLLAHGPLREFLEIAH
jgi:hypothetical protein